MKTKITLLAILISAISFGQVGMNYKALIKDANGNVIANQAVDVQIAIIADVPTGDTEYIETHTPVTDDNGIAILCIGEGSPDGNFSFEDINWKNTAYFLNVKVDIGGGFIDMGTSPFKYVPYAYAADHAPTNAVVTSPKYLDTNFTDFSLLSGSRIRVEVHFNIRMNTSSFALGSSVTLTGSGGSATGTLTWSNGGTRLVIVSNESFTTIAPCFSGGMTLTIRGSGSSIARDINNRPIDGDLNGYCGGNYEVTFDIVC